MKKKCVLLFVLLLSLVLPVVAKGTGTIQDIRIINPDSEVLYVSHLSAEFIANHDRAVAQHIEIYSAFPVNRSGHAMFPSYYGGHFIDEYGNLVMNIVASYGRMDVSSSIINEALSSRSVSSRLVRFSYTELQDTMEFLADSWDANPDCKIHNASVSFSLSIRNNHVRVGLYGYSEELKEAFRTYVLDSPMVVFVEGRPSALRLGQGVPEPTSVVICDDANLLNTPVNTLFYRATSRLLLILR